MPIQCISLYHVQLPMKFNFKTAKSELKVRDTLIIKVEDGQGHSGFGEAVAFTSPFYTAETLATDWQVLSENYLPLVLSQELSHPFELHQLISNPQPMAVAGLENALLDLYYKVRHQNTIQALFPENLKSEIPRGAVLGDMPIPQLLSEIRQLVQNGVRRIKVKIKPADGYERVSQVRKTFPDIGLAADANRSFDLADWPEIQRFDQLHLLCLEEPFKIDRLSDLADIKAQISTPLCFDESVQSLAELEELAQLPGSSMLNIKIGRLGGLYQTRQAVQLCRKEQIGFWIGSMVESGISKILHAQLAALSDNVMAGDLSNSAHYFSEDLIEPGLSFPQGKMLRPTEPGLGVAVNEAALDRYCIKKVEFSL